MGAPMTSQQSTADVRSILERFVAGFNDNTLDDVMEFFAEDAVYRPGDGNEYRGKAEIRRAFEPQFRGVYGKMFFAVDEMIVDDVRRRAALSWVCHHDLSGANGSTVPLPARVALKALFGSRTGWEGMDFFHFDERGKIIGKFSHPFGRRPVLRRALGRPL